MLRRLLGGLMGVSAFTVHEPPLHAGGSSRMERAESLLFVRDGFSWRAALFSPFYLLVRGEWRALAAYIGVATVLALLLSATGAKSDWIVWMFVLLNLITGFEASELKRWSLDRAGWQEVGSVSGRGHEEAERRFFEAWLPTLADRPSHAHGVPVSFVVSPEADLETRMEAAAKRLSQRLRERFAIKK
jgi:hypothetical protein